MRRAEWRSPLRLRTLNKTISIVFDDLQFFLFSDTIIYFGMDFLIGDSLCSTIVACGKWACWNSSLLSSVFLQLDTSLWPGRYTWRKNLSWQVLNYQLIKLNLLPPCYNHDRLESLRLTKKTKEQYSKEQKTKGKSLTYLFLKHYRYFSGKHV